jgi:XTP/dITP diphosphohydrolase
LRGAKSSAGALARKRPMDKLVLASGNPGKIREFQDLLAPYAIEVLAQNTLGIIDPPETGTTFVENAIIKARHAAQCSGLPALADDSGLCVDALDGAPGLISAYFAGMPSHASANNAKLLTQLTGRNDRTARFVSVIVFLRHAADPLPLIAQGQWHGEILRTAQGNDGFGYDPLFFDPMLGKSAAELAPELKNKVSHRGKAMAMLAQLLGSQFAQK